MDFMSKFDVPLKNPGMSLICLLSQLIIRFLGISNNLYRSLFP